MDSIIKSRLKNNLELTACDGINGQAKFEQKESKKSFSAGGTIYNDRKLVRFWDRVVPKFWY